MSTVPCPVCSLPEFRCSTVYVTSSHGQWLVTGETHTTPQCFVCNGTGILSNADNELYLRNKATFQKWLSSSNLNEHAVASVLGVSKGMLLRLKQGLGVVTDEQLQKLRPYVPMKD